MIAYSLPFSRALLCLAFLLPVTGCTDVRAQGHPAWSGFGIESNLITGKVIRHTEKMRGELPARSSAFELNFIQQTDGSKAWQQRRRYPMLGFGFRYTDYGLNDVYGKCLAMYPNIQIPIIRGKQLEWTLRVGFGVGYVSRRYERFPSYDTTNTAIGSHFNNFTVFSTDLRYHVSKQLDLQAGFNFSHMSNAALKQPNLGLNMYGAHIGIRYFPVTSDPERIARKLKPLKNRWLAQGRVGIAFNEAGYADGPIFPVYLASVYASKRWHSKNKFFAGLDYSYHTKITAFLRNNEILPGEEKAHAWKSAVFVGNEFMVGRVGLVLQVGYYLKQAYLKEDAYYEKLGGNLYLIQQERGFIKELFLSALLKTHKTQAELAEVGIGIGL